MAETLAGSISDMSLLEILKLIHSGKMSGCLVVNNSSANGEIYVQNGEVYHCRVGETIGQLALYQILGWINGRFTFESGMEIADKSVKANTEQLILYGTKRMKDWQEIKKVVTAMDNVFTLVPESPHATIEISLEEWKILARLNGHNSVAQIVKLLGEDEYTVAKILFQLFSNGLIEKVDHPDIPVVQTASTELMEVIEQELSRAIGPVSDLILLEQISILGEKKSTLSREMIPVLIEKLSDEISNSDKRERFKEVMLSVLNRY